MVYESYPWKQDLLRRKRLLVSTNTPIKIAKNEDAAYIVIEKAIFYTAFIIRKLLDCKMKLSDAADNYCISASKFQTNVHYDGFHNCINENSHNWDKVSITKIAGRKICNALIHSYVFEIEIDDNGVVVAFYVSSDYDKDKHLYKIFLLDWIDYIEFIGTDDVVGLSMHYDKKERAYIFSEKLRG